MSLALCDLSCKMTSCSVRDAVVVTPYVCTYGLVT